MDDIKEYLQKTVDMSYDELVLSAQNAISGLHERLSSFLEQEEAYDIILDIIFCTVAADKQLSLKEQQFFKDVLGADKAQALNAMLSGENRKAKEVVLALSRMNDETKAQVFILVSAIAAIDTEINVDELSLLQQILDS